jgi:hypothetical protein
MNYLFKQELLILNNRNWKLFKKKYFLLKLGKKKFNFRHFLLTTK